ncbi:MAG: DEAD/DEAH box helicase [Bacteriovoracaceae bacterium]
MNELLILTSPPASGKTFWIESMAHATETQILVISPLRALADECRHKWKDKILVMTPEEWLLKKTQGEIVIFDEFHLLFYWGDSFRPLMWEVFESLSIEAKLVIGLTATFAPEMQEAMERFRCGFDEIYWRDAGNQSLKWTPERYYKVHRSLLHRSIFGLPLERTSLIFCQYRHEVEIWEKKLSARGFRVWGCRGGEASAFSKRVQLEPAPDFIVATTVLSHGVNLPSIRRVFFLYPVGNKDFWIQMTARGGRRGEKFEVFALEPPHGLRWSKSKNLFHCATLYLRILVADFLDQLDQCFLKE